MNFAIGSTVIARFFVGNINRNYNWYLILEHMKKHRSPFILFRCRQMHRVPVQVDFLLDQCVFADVQVGRRRRENGPRLVCRRQSTSAGCRLYRRNRLAPLGQVRQRTRMLKKDKDRIPRPIGETCTAV